MQAGAATAAPEQKLINSYLQNNYFKKYLKIISLTFNRCQLLVNEK